MGSVENEDHFLLECNAYRQLHEGFFQKLNGIGINIINTVQELSVIGIAS